MKVYDNQLKTQIIDIFKAAQFTAAVHQKNSILLKRLYENSDNEIFSSILKEVILKLIITDGGNVFIERTMDFLALFFSIFKPSQIETNQSEDYIEHPIVSKVVLYLLEASNLHNDIVRFRSCQLINKILNQLVGSEVSINLCEKLEECLLKRLYDPKNIVRQQAVIALHRLQDPANKEDEIIQQFIHLLNSDGFAKVRLVCIENIAARTDVIKHIINRIRDVDLNVRLAAFRRLSNLAAYLKISQKRHILHCGFLDTSDKVVELITTNLIPQWLDHYEENILLLMKSVRLDADEKDIKKTVILFDHILGTLFKVKPFVELTRYLDLTSTKLIPIENLNWETACYWRAYVQFLSQREELEDELEKVIPELVFFCQYVKEYYSNTPVGNATVDFLEKQFILKQLFLIIKTYDFADVTNRQYLNALVCNILEKVDLMSDVIEVVVKCLEHSIPEINSRSQFVSEIISEIMYPMDSEESQRKEKEKEFQISKIKVQINCLLDEQQEAVTKENFKEAERLKHAIVEANTAYKELKNSHNSPPRQVRQKTEIPTVIKYLDIAASVLLSPQITHLNSTLRALKDNIIQELLIHDNDNVRAKALRCYALCCIVDKECALTGIHIFSTPIFAYQNGEECDTHTLITCIGAAVDLLRIFGPQLMAAPDDNVLSESMEEAHERVFAGGTSLTDLVQGLVDLMDDEQYEIQEKAVLGLCQLILSDRIHSPSLISRLVLKWCSPASEDDGTEKLTQIIGFTLEKVPMRSDVEQLEQAVLRTIKVLAMAPKNSPLSDVNLDNTASFMIALCKISPKGNQIQGNIAIQIGFEIKDNPKSKLNVTLSKILLSLDIPDNKLIIRDLLKICDEIRDGVKERQVLNNIVKYVSSLSTKNIDHSLTEELHDEKELTNTSRAV